MYVYIIGGFLGSGKTTLLMNIASRYTKNGKKVAILVNEAGEIGVDGATLKAEGYDAIELPDGCICCSLTGALQNAVKSIKRDIDPDIMLVEPTGLALPHKVKELIHVSMIDPDGMFIIGVADIQRFDDLIKKKEEFFKMQMVAADFILINKCDIATTESLDRATKWLSSTYPNKPILNVSTKNGDNMDKVMGMMQ